MFRFSVRNSGSFSFNRQSLAILVAGAVALLLIAPATGKAADCTIATHGEPAYESVKLKLKANYKNPEFFQFAKYKDIDVSVSSDCNFKLHGKFSFKKARNLKRKIFDAEVTPKQGAPNGMKVVKLRTSNE